MNIDQKSNNGLNCLMYACRTNSNPEIVKYLIQKHKMDPNHTDKWNSNSNCLVYACENKQKIIWIIMVQVV